MTETRANGRTFRYDPVMIRSLGLLLLIACDGAAAAPTPTPLPAPAPATPVVGDHACGAFSSKDLAAKEVGLLDDRIRVRFLASPKVEGNAASVRAVVNKGGASAFVGARELFMQGDADFARHATKNAAFDGDYDPVTIPARGGVSIVAGLLKAAPASSDVVSVAHGWFLNGTKDVLDVAVFISGVTAANLAECRLFAVKVLSTVTSGSRVLKYGTGATVETKVSYATFSYVLPTDWILASDVGIHDFARMTFRRRGIYPDGFTDLQLGLDSHPGDWGSPGGPDGTRPGKVFGLDVTWNQTKSKGMFGAWTISKGVKGRDHAVASITSGSGADRDAALKFAESITAK